MAERLVVFLAVALPFVAAGLAPLLFRALGERLGYAAALVALTSFGLVASQRGEPGTVEVAWVPSLDVAMRFQVDGLAVLFALLASGIGVLVFTYSAVYMHDHEHLARYYGTLLAFMGSILGVAFAADLIALFLFWELTSLCSFVLIGHHTEERASRYSARMAMIVTVGGGLCLLVAAVLLSLAASEVGLAAFDLAAMLENEEAMVEALRDRGLFVPTLALIAVAAGAKSAQVPLHFWLPNAMVAPTPVSAFLHSATMVKVGVYLIGRLRPLLVSEEWMLLFATLGLATMTVGAVLAVAATDIKELLAYSTASHLGLMVAGFGFQSAYGAEAGGFHLFNHALFKAALFLVAGIVAHETGTRRLHDLGGLWRDLPVTAAVTVVAALSMAGIPPFNGFYSKELLFEAAYEAAHEGGSVLLWLFPIAAVFASVFTVLYSVRFLSIFLGDRPGAIGAVHRPPVAMVAPPAVLGLLAAVTGAAPGYAIDAVVQSAVDAAAVGHAEVHAEIPTHLSAPVVMSAIAIGGGLAAYPFYGRIERTVAAATAARAALRPSSWYDWTISGVEAVSARFGPLVHNGRLRTYVAWAVATASALALLGYAAAAGLPALGSFGVSLPMALVLAVAIVAAVAVTIAPSHVAGVLTLSILGFMVAIFYILASAPDLALTQLVVETLVLLIFLVVLEELPAFYADVNASVVARDAALSLFVGATTFVTVLLTARDPENLTGVASHYAENAIEEGGGTNIVNVILVDFRGFDTLGEIVVVSIAAISVLVLISMRTMGESP